MSRYNSWKRKQNKEVGSPCYYHHARHLPEFCLYFTRKKKKKEEEITISFVQGRGFPKCLYQQLKLSPFLRCQQWRNISLVFVKMNISTENPDGASKRSWCTTTSNSNRLLFSQRNRLDRRHPFAVGCFLRYVLPFWRPKHSVRDVTDGRPSSFPFFCRVCVCTQKPPSLQILFCLSLRAQLSRELEAKTKSWYLAWWIWTDGDGGALAPEELSLGVSLYNLELHFSFSCTILLLKKERKRKRKRKV